MKTPNSSFDEHEVLHELKHYLPAQAPLKDFVHHNTLHAFQENNFHAGLQKASEIFGYKVSLSLDEYREHYQSGRIKKEVLERILFQSKGRTHVKEWLDKMVSKKYSPNASPRIGALRANWKRQYRIDLDSLVHPTLFRIVCSFLDQGIAMWNFPVLHQAFLPSIREMERNSFTSFFKTERARNLLLYTKCELPELLRILVGDESLYAHYLFDQQFAHQGWSGIVSAIEDQPEALLDTRQISLHDLILFELLLEIDALDFSFGDIWAPLGTKIRKRPKDLFAPLPESELSEVMTMWQDAFEWSYYDEVLAGISLHGKESEMKKASLQAMFCIDDREISLRQYLEQIEPNCETFGTPGFFNVECYYKPEHSKFHTKVCPAPVTPKYLIKELGTTTKHKKDAHFTKHTHGLFRGWIITQTLGFWSAFKLFVNLFYPTMSPATASSFRHMDKYSKLTIENDPHHHSEGGLQVGYTIPEMAQRVEGLLNSIGLVRNFAPLVYIVGHGSSSVNNPYYAAYDCGACCGRPGSVNARAASFMANHPAVREILRSRGVDIPDDTQFLGALHDTACDEIAYYDEDILTPANRERHLKNQGIFADALDLNAKERSRRFVSINTRNSPKRIHNKIRRRIVSLFEPRPELNHATNALCIVGRRTLTQNLFLDRRAFLNSYDYRIDPTGKYLLGILRAAAPVCGGINLEYFFSRVDNQKLGAGTKLPHNVMGLFGVANGADGDLRPGLPSQMIEVHDPVRLLMVVEHFPEVVLETIKTSPPTYEWFLNEWVHLAVINPETQLLCVFKDGAFFDYHTTQWALEPIADLTSILEEHQDNLPVYVVPKVEKQSKSEQQPVVAV